jgi:hypothetical protein
MITNILQTKSKNLLIAFTLLVLCTSIILLGCKPQNKGEPPTKLAETYLEYVKSGQSEKAIALYSDRMFEKVPKEDWLKTLSIYRDYHGDLKSYKLELTKKVQNKQKEYSGNYSYLVYRIQYDKQEAQEVITIRQPIGGGTSEIAGHYLSVEIVEPSKLLERIFKEQSSTAKEETTKEEIPKGEPKIEVTPKEDTAKEQKN